LKIVEMLDDARLANYTVSTELEISTMVSGNSITDYGQPEFVERLVPAPALKIASDSGSRVHFGIGERFVVALIPADARINLNSIREVARRSSRNHTCGGPVDDALQA
jgi:hypothetical protein